MVRIAVWYMDLNPVFEKHRRWAEAAGRADLVAAADLGLQRVRRNASRAAFDMSRAAKREGDLVEMARWLAMCVAREPGFVLGILWSKVTGRPDSSPEGHRPE